MEHTIKDSNKEQYEITILQEEDKYKDYILNKINELWVHTNIECLKNMLSTKYSPDGLPTTFVVTKNQEVVGFCSLLRKDSRFREDVFPWFGNCYVAENFRRRGIMNAMQDYACEYAKEKGFSNLYLWTKDKNLYDKLGWQYLEDIYVDKNETAHLFVKKL